jgi:predicted pyridoxine 5'-phosphate oxidase superfamily flavin-nucleotide-binding protein
MTDDHSFYHEGMRALQDRFDGRRLADSIGENRVDRAFTDRERQLIETAPFFFIATSYGEHTDCSMKSGMPGFVKIVAPDTLEYPEYDGNSMYRTLGNISPNPNIGLLFVKFDGKTYRLRLNGHATILDDTGALARPHAAKLVVRVTGQLYPNCARSVHDLANGQLSPYLPHPDYDPPAPSWKEPASIQGLLPKDDPHREKHSRNQPA